MQGNDDCGNCSGEHHDWASLDGNGDYPLGTMERVAAEYELHQKDGQYIMQEVETDNKVNDADLMRMVTNMLNQAPSAPPQAQRKRHQQQPGKGQYLSCQRRNQNQRCANWANRNQRQSNNNRANND